MAHSECRAAKLAVSFVASWLPLSDRVKQLAGDPSRKDCSDQSVSRGDGHGTGRGQRGGRSIHQQQVAAAAGPSFAFELIPHLFLVAFDEALPKLKKQHIH
jgi:hypothetical protein